MMPILALLVGSCKPIMFSLSATERAETKILMQGVLETQQPLLSPKGTLGNKPQRTAQLEV